MVGGCDGRDYEIPNHHQISLRSIWQCSLKTNPNETHGKNSSMMRYKENLPRTIRIGGKIVSPLCLLTFLWFVFQLHCTLKDEHEKHMFECRHSFA